MREREREAIFYFYMQTCTGTYNVHATCIFFYLFNLLIVSLKYICSQFFLSFVFIPPENTIIVLIELL